MQKISELDPADAVRAIAPLYTSLDFISAGAAPQDGKKPKGPTTARQALRPPWLLPLLRPYVIRGKREKEGPPDGLNRLTCSIDMAGLYAAASLSMIFSPPPPKSRCPA